MVTVFHDLPSGDKIADNAAVSLLSPVREPKRLLRNLHHILTISLDIEPRIT